MKIVSTHNHSQEVRDLCHQISTLEEQFVEQFIGDGDRSLLKKIHVQIKVLKMELQYKESNIQ